MSDQAPESDVFVVKGPRGFTESLSQRDAVLVCTRYATSLDLNGTTYVALSSGGAS